MGKEILTFGDTEIEKTIFIAIKVLFLRNIRMFRYLTKFLLMKQITDTLFVTGHHDYKIKPLHIMLR